MAQLKTTDGLLLVLTIVFIALKLDHIVQWSWWTVFSPIWASILGWLIYVGLILAPLPIRFIGIASVIMFFLVQLSKYL